MSNFKSFFFFFCSAWWELNIQIIFALLSDSLFVFPFKKKILSFNCWRVSARWGKEIITMHTKNSKKRYFLCVLGVERSTWERDLISNTAAFAYFSFTSRVLEKKRKINGLRVRESEQKKSQEVNFQEKKKI